MEHLPQWVTRYRVFRNGETIIPEPFRDDLEQESGMKPAGLWFTPSPNDWVEWCTDNMPDWLSKTTLGWIDVDLSRILVLSTEHELLEFGERFPGRSCGLRGRYGLINWKAVAAEYDGIEVVPYLYNLRMDLRAFWYYSWDVSSGCVWRRRSLRHSL